MKYILYFILLLILIVSCESNPTTNLKQFPIVEKTQKPQVSAPDTCYHQWIHTEFAIYMDSHRVRPCGVNICTKCGIMIFDPNYLNVIEKTNNPSYGIPPFFRKNKYGKQGKEKEKE